MFHLMVNGQKTGPYTVQDLQQMYRQGAIGDETQFWQEGSLEWKAIGSNKPFLGITGGTAYQAPPQYNPGIGYQSPPMVVQQVVMQQAKSRVAYILLGLFLGGLGIHNFYAGYTGKGVAQLLLTLFLFWTIVVPIGVGIWIIIEVITVDHDSMGVRMI